MLGSPETALTAPNSIVLTESISNKLFGNENPMGQKVLLTNSDEYTVTGVVCDIEKFHMNINAFVSLMDVVRSDGNDDFLTARNHNFDIYVLTKPNIIVDDLAAKIIKRGAEEFNSQGYNFLLRPFNDIYFATDLPHEHNTKHGNMTMIVVFSIIAVLILLIACINFVNLTIAKSSTRDKEIALRKVVGAKQSSLQKQFFGETFLIVIISFMFSLFAVNLLLPKFNELTGEQMNFASLDLNFILTLVGIIFFTVFVSGIYPSFYLSLLKPVLILKGKSGTSKKGNSFSRILISIQFAISIFLIISTITVIDQLYYIQHKNLGMNLDQILITTLRGDKFSSRENTIANKQLFKEKLLESPLIDGVTYFNQLPGEIKNTWGWYVDNKEELTPMKIINTNPDFFDVMGIELLEGRLLSEDLPTDLRQPPTEESVMKHVINEAAVKALNLTDPVGKIINSGHIEIIGVVKDFNYNSLHTKIEPLGISWDYWPTRTCIKMKGDNMSEAISYMEKVYSEFCPGFGFEYDFLDESFAKNYASEKRLEILLSYFVGVAITLSCLGLFALTAFFAERKSKEIAIRKVLGSSERSILFLLSKGFLVSIVTATTIAWPVAYYLLNGWMENFAYHVPIRILYFIAGTVLALIIAFGAIAYQALKAAGRNPVDSLKVE